MAIYPVSLGWFRKMLTLLSVLSTIIISGCYNEDSEPMNVNFAKLLNLEGIQINNDFELPNLNVGEKFVDEPAEYELYDTFNDISWNYRVILPPDFDETKQYSTLYLLHGRSSNCGQWEISLKITDILNYYFYQDLPSLIIIMPDAWDTYYVNDFMEGIKYETFFINQFIPEMEKRYPLSTHRSKRYIGGFSMGGYGSLYYTFKYNELFSFCYAMSTPLYGRDSELTPPIVKFDNPFISSNPTEIILDIGLDDPWLNANIESHYLFLLKGISHDMILRSGSHNAQFWKESLFLLFERLQAHMEKFL